MGGVANMSRIICEGNMRRMPAPPSPPSPPPFPPPPPSPPSHPPSPQVHPPCMHKHRLQLCLRILWGGWIGGEYNITFLSIRFHSALPKMTEPEGFFYIFFVWVSFFHDQRNFEETQH